MRTILALLLALALPLASADTATIYGTLLTPNGVAMRTSILFEHKGTPGALDTNVVANFTVLARSGANGYFTTNLVAGNYRVTVKGVAPWPDSTFYALVPSGTGSYDLASLVTNALTASPSAWYVLLSTVTNKGDIYVATASGTVTRLGAGTSNQVLTVDPSASTGLKWAAQTAGSSTNGGTVTSVNATSATTALTISGGPITDSGTLNFGLHSNLVNWASLSTNQFIASNGGRGTNVTLIGETIINDGIGRLTTLSGSYDWGFSTNGAADVALGGYVSGGEQWIWHSVNAEFDAPAYFYNVSTGSAGMLAMFESSGKLVKSPYVWTNLTSWTYAMHHGTNYGARSGVPVFSITNNSDGFKLNGDQDFGAESSYTEKHYGINQSGTRGWYDTGFYLYSNGVPGAVVRYLDLLPGEGINFQMTNWTPPSVGQTLQFNVNTNSIATRDWVQAQGYGSGGSGGITNTFNANQFAVSGSGSVSNVALKSGLVVTNLSEQATLTASALTVTNGLTVGGNVLVTGQIRSGGAQPIYWDSRTTMYSTGSGYLTLQNLTGGNTNFYGLSLGGGSSGALDAYHVLLNSTGNVLRVTHGADPNGTNRIGGAVFDVLGYSNWLYAATYDANGNRFFPIAAGTGVAFTTNSGVITIDSTGGAGATNAVSTIYSNGVSKVTGATSIDFVASGNATVSVVSNATTKATVTITGTSDSAKLSLTGGTISGQLNMGESGTLILPQTNASVTVNNLSFWYDGAEDDGGKRLVFKDGGGDLKTLPYIEDGAYQATNAALTKFIANQWAVSTLSPIGGTNFYVDFSTQEAIISVTNNVYFVYSTNSSASASVAHFHGITLVNDSASVYTVGFNSSWRALGTAMTTITNGKIARISFMHNRGTAETNVVYGTAYQN